VFLLTFVGKHLSMSSVKLCHGYILKNSWKEPVYYQSTYCSFIPQWSDQFLNISHRSGTLPWPSLKLSIWRLFNVGLLTLFWLLLLYSLSYYTDAGWHFISSCKMLGSLQAFVFRNIWWPNSSLHHLIPPPRDLAMTSCLCKPTVYPRPSLGTKRYCSTVSYALQNFLL